MVLGSGVCRVPDLIKHGIQVGLGTDSAASNNNLSMLNEMQTAAKLHKVFQNNAALIDAPKVLRMATTNGSQIYRHKNTGQLSKGYRADLQIIDLSDVHNTPYYDVTSTLVYSSHSNDVTGLIVNGNILMKDREIWTVNEEEILNSCKQKGIEIADFMRKQS